MPMRQKLLAGLAGLAGGWLCLYFRLYRGEEGDFWWALRFADDLLRGADPYGFTPSARLVPYPLTVALFGLPLVWLPWLVAAAIFFGLSTGLLAYGALRAGEGWRLCVMLSAPFVTSAVFTQWSPLIMAAAFVPALAPLLALIKPQVALPVALMRRPSAGGIVLALAVLALSLLLMPSWPLRWLGMLGDFERMIPLITLPFGPLLLLAALRWRNERARLLLLMAIMPQRAIYDLVPLWLVPARPLMAAAMVVFSWLAFLVLPSPIVQPTWAVPLIYLPALISLFWPRAAARPDAPSPAVGITPGKLD
ncbi:MAG: hypothetical protein IPO81_13640 [Kouleothrix sp.]|nr:hypothetical protein [Kouleothrix sp.]